MEQSSTQNILGGTRKHFFVLFGLLFLSGAFFVTASEELSGKNIVDDPDQDDLTTEEERLYGTDPMNRDTDGDGYSDGVEVRSGYDPLRKAPGDKIVSEEAAALSASVGGVGGENLTEQTAQEIANLIKNTQEEGDGNVEVSLDELNVLAQDIASGNLSEEVILPEVDADSIKVKELSCKKLSEKKCDEKKKEDIVEYLTVIAYIFANNSPENFKTQDELEDVSDSLVNEAVAALSFGDISQLDALAENGEKMLSQIYEVEVPEEMLDIHMKAIKLAKYAASLKGELSVDPNEDPMKTISSLSKTQGLLNVIVGFVADVQGKAVEYGIDDISIEGL